MIPLRPASLFRSRWAALFYAAGVLWFAMDVAGTRQPQETNATAATPANDINVNALQAEINQFESIK